MKKRFLFHRVHILADGAAVDQSVKNATPVFPYPANTFLAIRNYTMMRAQLAANAISSHLFVKHRFLHLI
jgi:hypothetical protein